MSPSLKRASQAKAYGAPEQTSPGLASTRRRQPEAVVSEEPSGILRLVDDLAVLAADLWFAGKLDHFPLDEVPADVDDE